MTIGINWNSYEGHGRTIVHEGFIARHPGITSSRTKYMVERKQLVLSEPDPSLGRASEPSVGSLITLRRHVLV